MTHGIITRMVENTADLINKLHVGTDGKTAYERIKGKGYRGEFLEFGSSIFHRIPDNPQGGLMAPRWGSGIWLGKRFSTDEHVIGLEDGRVIRTRSVRAKPAEDFWSLDGLSKVKGQPWDPSVTLTYAKMSEDRFPKIPEPHAAEEECLPKPRATKITTTDPEKAGWTPGCAKCRTLAECYSTNGGGASGTARSVEPGSKRS